MRHETRAMDLDMKGGRWQVTVKSLHFVALIETLDERQGGHVVPNERAGILEGGSAKQRANMKSLMSIPTHVSNPLTRFSDLMSHVPNQRAWW